MQLYNSCPKRYKLHYVDNLREKVSGSARVFGNAMDASLNALNTGGAWADIYENEMAAQKINGVLEDLSTSPNLKYSNADFDPDILSTEEKKTISGVFEEMGFIDLPSNLESLHEQLKAIKRTRPFNDDERQIFQYMSWFSLKKKGKLMLEAYIEQVVPRIKRVIAVQKYFEVYNSAGDSLLGYIDMICEYVCPDGQTRLIRFDHKASSEKYTEKTIDEKKQLATYTFGTEAEWPEKDVGYIVMPKKFRKKKLPLIPIEIVIGKITAEQEEKLIDLYDEMLHNVRQNKFPCKYGSCDKTDDPFGCPYAEYNKNGSMDGLVKLERKKKDE